MAESFTLPLEFNLIVDGEPHGTEQTRWVWEMHSPVLFPSDKPATWKAGPPIVEVRLSNEIVEDLTERYPEGYVSQTVQEEASKVALRDILYFLDAGLLAERPKHKG